MNQQRERDNSDQFDTNQATLAKDLMTLGCDIERMQRHKAEADVAVAAASILARNEFVSRLIALEKQFAAKLPKGASGAVDELAREFVARQGVENLPKVAKMHFRNAFRAQGLLEPPKKQWRRSHPSDGKN